jgi:hypothetical protein
VIVARVSGALACGRDALGEVMSTCSVPARP